MFVDIGALNISNNILNIGREEIHNDCLFFIYTQRSFCSDNNEAGASSRSWSYNVIKMTLFDFAAGILVLHF